MEEVEFKDNEQLQDKLIQAYLDKYLEATGHNVKDVVLIKEVKGNETYFYFRRKKDG